MSEVRLACCYMVHSDHWYLEESILSFRCPEGGASYDIFLFLSKFPWGGKAGDTQKTKEIAERNGVTVIEGIWLTEDEQRRHVITWARENGYTHLLLPDSDEIIELDLLKHIVFLAQNEVCDRLYVTWDTYWRTPEYVVRPRESFTPIIMIDVRVATQKHLRDYEGGRPLFLNDTFGIIHHLSYCGPDARIFEKINSWGHRTQVKPGWFESVWLKWFENRLLRNLNPVIPEAYACVERIAVPEILRPAFDKSIEYGADVRMEVAQCKGWQKMSAVIASRNGLERIRTCLEHLYRIPDLIHEIIVVDNGSCAEVLEYLRAQPINLIELGENKGFGYATNRGIERVTGSIALLLNNDCYVTRPGIVQLGNSLLSSASIAAAGPMTNNAAYGHAIDPTYQDLDNLERFCEDFANRSAVDIDRDMLAFFCVAIRKSVIDEVGLLSELYGLGTWEDNSYCHRLIREGFRLVLSTRSYCHHVGSQTFGEIDMDFAALMRHNQEVFIDEFKDDIESGFATGLAGLSAERIQFNQARKPEKLKEEYARKAKRLGIWFFLICRDEERCISDAIDSVHWLADRIVVNDTGSIDRTMEILRQYPKVTLIENEWEQDFSLARNQGLELAGGQFNVFMDADDIMTLMAAVDLIDDIQNMAPDVAGMFMDIRYSKRSKTPGLRVTHLKVVRNRPEFRFEHMIHEQILPSVRKSGMRVTRSRAYLVHEHYDESPEGQAKKKARDEPILYLDVARDPHNPFKNWNIGMSLFYWGEPENAIPWFEKAIRYSEPGGSQVGPSYTLWARSLHLLGRKDEALAKAREGIVACPEDLEIRFLIGLWCLEIGRFQEARNNLRKVVGAEVNYLTSMDHDIMGHKGLFNLGCAEFGLGHYDVARDCWLKALELAPGEIGSAIKLAETAIQVKDFPTANTMIERIERQLGHCQLWASMIFDFQETVLGKGRGFGFLDSWMQRNPAHFFVRVELALRLMKAERPGDAVPHLLALDQQNNPSGAYHLSKLCTQSGDHAGALSWMTRAQSLDPASEELAKEIDKLALAARKKEA